jgi:cyclic beta-1,2-glucan synthetase
LPPQPWINVIANPSFGFTVSETGGGFTWAGNSQLHRLTPWQNDPVSDVPGEMIYLRDETNGDFWAATPLPIGNHADFTVRHGQGYTIFMHQKDGIACELTLFASPEAPMKWFQVRLHNRGAQQRRLSALFYAEWVLGTERERTAAHIVTEVDAQSGVLFARSAWDADFKDQVAFADVSCRPRSVSGDRAEFLGRHGSVLAPAACQRDHLSGKVGACLDPCAALRTSVVLRPQEVQVLHFVLGETSSVQDARRLAQRCHDPKEAQADWQATRQFWSRLNGTLTMRSPSPALDLLVNRWLLCQILSCRMWGRSALYQSGGAYGFRDQLQDALALVYAFPEETRRHLLRAAGRQFVEGDVQHWWHPPRGAGVRTRISDDYLWLPYAVYHYVRITGDEAVLGEPVPFLQAPVLRPDQEEDYRTPDVSDESAPLYEHCVRAIKHGLRFGGHGLPLMGAGDWNDGMNRVGNEGRGESVWVGWFLLSILECFAELCERRGEPAQAQSFRQEAKDLRSHLELHAWDGRWYRRAYFDDGRPLGSASNDECRIDSLVQSWAVISGGANPERARQAMEEVDAQLVRREDRLVLLFTPPFDKGDLQPGYIKGYLPGIRENGGQYTHAALWVAQAWAMLGDGARTIEILELLNPILHTDSPASMQHYRLEPYVVAADIYGAPPHTGRGGWSWYTGSAGWYYRVVVEHILGFRKRGNHFYLRPCLPPEWPQVEITYRFHSTVYEIRVDNSGQTAGPCCLLDGQPWEHDAIPLRDDGQTHAIVVALKGRS